MEVGPDFDPLTEEGSIDINDDEYESLIPNENVDPQGLFDKLRRRFGDRARAICLAVFGRKVEVA